MVRLPPPPRFAIPPPPMPPTELFDAHELAQLTCSSIRQSVVVQSTWTSTRLFLLASASCLIVILLLTIMLISLLAIRKQKQLQKQRPVKSSSKPSPATIDSITDWSTNLHRSYETVTTDHTGDYVESVDTSATTYSIETDSIICVECQRERRELPEAPYYHVLNIPDLVPN